MLQNDVHTPNVRQLKPWKSREGRSPNWTDLAIPKVTRTELPAYTAPMNDITREEFNAKLETIEAKMDARVQAVTSKIDGFLASQDERDKRLDLLLAQISKDSGEAKTSISSMKSTLIVTAVSTVLAIVIGVASFNTALTSNMMSAFQLGASRSDSVRQQEAPSSPPAATEPLTTPEAKAPASPPPNTSNDKARH